MCYVPPQDEQLGMGTVAIAPGALKRVFELSTPILNFDKALANAIRLFVPTYTRRGVAFGRSVSSFWTTFCPNATPPSYRARLLPLAIQVVIAKKSCRTPRGPGLACARLTEAKFPHSFQRVGPKSGAKEWGIEVALTDQRFHLVDDASWIDALIRELFPQATTSLLIGAKISELGRQTALQQPAAKTTSQPCATIERFNHQHKRRSTHLRQHLLIDRIQG